MMKNTCIALALSLMMFDVAAQQNIALHKPVSATSAQPANIAEKAVDGKISRTSQWVASNGKPPHIFEVNLQKYYTVTEIRVHSGIMDSEKRSDEMTQAAGFWSVKNFKLQYWDDANWSDLPKSEVHENRQVAAVFTYNPSVVTYKIRLVSDDGEPISIMEIEVIGTETPNMPEPPKISTDIRQAETSLQPKNATLKIRDAIVGKSMKYVGYNQGYYFPGSNISGWLEYSNVNSVRVWATLNAFVPQKSVQVDKAVITVEEFDKRKAELRSSPENNAFIKWNELLPLYDEPDSSSTNAMVFNYALAELKRLGIDVGLQMGSTDFNNTWDNKWKQWQRYYALAYYTAKVGDVSMFAMQNEPNHRNSGPMKLDQWISGMQIVSDAVHAAVEDVNRQYNKTLTAKFVGPVTAGNNPEWWAAVAKNMRTDYHGQAIEKDLLQVFSTHSYNSPAAGYESRISNIRKILEDNHPAKQAPPITYTEIGRWMNAYLIDKEETMDSPSLFTEWAGIYANNMKNGGYGMWAFKFANTASGTYPRGIKSGHHFIWQGKRIVEDAYTNLALNKKVQSSTYAVKAKLVVDGDKSDASAWIADTAGSEKWIEIDLGSSKALGSAVVYTGSAGGVYTSPDRIRNFKLQYFAADGWKDIPGAVEKDNKYAQVFMEFTEPVTTAKVRFISNDKGSLKVREIKLFGKDDGPSAKADYNVSGIQRTGEVVRLFAKGFRNERPLLETKASVADPDLDSYTTYDAKSGNYYIWLVQRGMFDYDLKVDVSELDVRAGSPVTGETVSATLYGEASVFTTIDAARKFSVKLTPQTVMLITIPKGKTAKTVIHSTADATVAGGKSAATNYGMQKQLSVKLDAGQPENNRVSYIHFHLGHQSKPAQKIILAVNGKVDKGTQPYRLHVYAIPSDKLDQTKLNWKNAPYLDAEEALIKQVGQQVFIAGELAFTNKLQEHRLDVTDVVNRHASKGVTFVLVRETRQLGDDVDKGRAVLINSSESLRKPSLLYWSKN